MLLSGTVRALCLEDRGSHLGTVVGCRLAPSHLHLCSTARKLDPACAWLTAEDLPVSQLLPCTRHCRLPEGGCGDLECQTGVARVGELVGLLCLPTLEKALWDPWLMGRLLSTPLSEGREEIYACFCQLPFLSPSATLAPYLMQEHMG